MTRHPLDRSAAFTALLDLSPDGFGKMESRAAEQVVTRFLESWYASGSKDMYVYARGWAAGRWPSSGAEMAARRTAAAAVLKDYERAVEGADIATRAMWGARLADALACLLAGLDAADAAGGAR